MKFRSISIEIVVEVLKTEDRLRRRRLPDEMTSDCLTVGINYNGPRMDNLVDLIEKVRHGEGESKRSVRGVVRAVELDRSGKVSLKH